MRKHSLEFSGFLPHLQPVVEKVGDFKPDLEPFGDFALLAALLAAQPGVGRHVPGAAPAFCNEFSCEAGADAVRGLTVSTIERINFLERGQSGIEIPKLQQAHFTQLTMVESWSFSGWLFLTWIFHPGPCIAQNTCDIGQARLVMVIRAAAQFSFDSMKLTGAGSFQVMLFAISQDNSLVMIRVTPPRQNFPALPPFLPYFLCMRCGVSALSGAGCRSAAACFRYRATLRRCSASVAANR